MTQPQNPAEDPELDRMAATCEDEFARGADEEPGEVSIDDALETDRVVAEGPDSRNADGYGFDADVDRGGDDVTAAEQGNREQDRMEAEDGEQELPEDL
ncbi:MAG: hypothetical protein L0J84_14700 [Brachybacterium sp.]|nr:hypothetical protein [Brachybacterium sp.]MDN6330573.1 hypothetical protein [Brachybacterium sp.]